MFIEPGKATFTNWSLSNGSLCFTTSCVCICSAFVEWPGMLFPNSRDIKLLQISAFHEYRLISLKIHKLTIYLSLHAERILLWAPIAANDKGTDADPFGCCCPAPCPDPFDQQGANLPLHPWLELPKSPIDFDSFNYAGGRGAGGSV